MREMKLRSAVASAALTLSLLAFLVPVSRAADGSAAADWTVMVYMNAKNNLEPAGLTNFLQMAQVGSTDRVNIVVELGRPEKKHYTRAEGNWSGVLRFKVAKNMHPVPGSAIDPDNPMVRHADMGSGAVLADFVQWAKTTFPAKKNMLLIWNHGQGWRLYLAELNKSALNKTLTLHSLSPQVRAVRVDGRKAAAAPVERPLSGGFRSVSFDEDTHNFLYNRDIQDSLHGQNLDVIGFDACLMGMMESAYAFRNIAKVMVASEELIPGDGWKYDSWIQELVTTPGMDAVELGKELVSSYKQAYQDTGNMTLSAVDLARAEETRAALSAFSLAVLGKIQSEGVNLAAARQAAQNYGDWYGDSWEICGTTQVLRFHGIDLDHFLAHYRTMTQDSEIQTRIDEVRQKLAPMILSSYASSNSAGEKYWSNGVSIYFPGSQTDFRCDQDGEGYDVPKVRAGGVKFPLEFVEKEGWGDLVYAYLQTQIAAQAPLDF